MTGIAQPIHRAAVVPTREFDIFCMLAEGGATQRSPKPSPCRKNPFAYYAIRLHTVPVALRRSSALAALRTLSDSGSRPGWPKSVLSPEPE